MPIIVVLPLARKKCGLTQEELAELSQRSQQLIGKLEQNKAKGIGFETLSQLCKATEGQIWDILVYVPDDPKKLDEALAALSKKLNCSIDELLPYIPKDLKAAYRKSMFV
ncbi:helix-turn-helix domain-containing protein [Spirulina sp. 06S082]|uniref:helix-turn-helix domain-containing protein n=1 Tax=Spirulina sp. 06S082 TaxID=3110248 RepID=UPI002B1F0A4E|nr:helix-turn-helix domain-containing protein [Spirulina sp. 06S082]MEA5470586.1 helix-turn-helix domain-containing protein [Spirulina sp. 06S082]